MKSPVITTLLLVGALAAPGGLGLVSGGLLPSSLLSRLPSSDFTPRQCMMCKFAVSLVNYALKTQRGADQVYRIANNFCSLAHIETPPVCSQVTKLFNREIVKVLSHGIVTTDQVCGYLSNNKCGTFHNPVGDWEVNLNVSVSLNQEELAKMRRNLQLLRQTQDPYRVIHISDTHVDLRYSPGSEVKCLEPLCCRNASNSLVPDKIQLTAGPWGSYGQCEVPLNTFESLLKELNRTLISSRNIDYIIWTGDIQPHDIWEQTKDGARTTYKAVFDLIFRYLPNARIYPTLGNHEMVPVDSYSPSNLLSIAGEDSPQWLYKEVGAYWRRWLPDDTQKTITKDGFYAVSPRQGLKIISLNTNFCHASNFWLYIDSSDPGNQLEWLIHELQISELEHEQVHIIGHIPPGVDDCLMAWSRNFNRIVRRFSRTIAGQFYGHTHNSEFELFYDQDGSEPDGALELNFEVSRHVWKPISAGFIGPSVTTFVDLNPSFRIYTVDPNRAYIPTDFETIFMNLTAANANGEAHQPDWISAGSFTKQFSIKDVSPMSLHSLLIDLVGPLTGTEGELPNAGRTEGAAVASSPSLPSTGDKVQLAEPNNSLSALSGVVDDRNEKLFELYRLYNSFSDMFTRTSFDAITSEARKKFLCRFVTGQSHNLNACTRFIGPLSS